MILVMVPFYAIVGVRVVLHKSVDILPWVLDTPEQLVTGRLAVQWVPGRVRG